ncbi:MAG: hydrogenase maturation nickel metallochaperone HypA [bacterium]
MHELPIAESVLELALEHAERAGGGRITGLHLRIGRLSSVVDESLQFYWDLISEDTPAEGARLHFHRVPLKFRCGACGRTFEPDDEDFSCTRCGSPEVRVVQGKEFHLEAIDLEQEPARQGRTT